MTMRLLPIWLIFLVCFSSCVFTRVNKYKNIIYSGGKNMQVKHAQELTIFSPKKTAAPARVLLFIHGGNWNSGKKSLYGFFAKRLAAKGIVAVLLDYPLSPEADWN